MKLTGIIIVLLLTASVIFTTNAAVAGPGSVKHGAKKGTQTSTAGKSTGARTTATAGSTTGARTTTTTKSTTTARATTATRPATQPSNRQSARAGYGAGSRHGYSRGYHHGRYHGRYSAWESARRDYYRWRTVTGLIKLGVYYSSKPKQSTTVVVTGTTYYYANGVYYVSSGSGYVVTSPPPGAVVYAVPTYTTVVYVGTTPYYYVNGVYYVATDAPAQQPPPPEQSAQVQAAKVETNAAASKDSAVAEAEATLDDVPMTDEDYNYEVVGPPPGATVPYLPEEADEQQVAGKTYFVYDGTYYKPFASDGETIYMVVEDPNTAETA